MPNSAPPRPTAASSKIYPRYHPIPITTHTPRHASARPLTLPARPACMHLKTRLLGHAMRGFSATKKAHSVLRGRGRRAGTVKRGTGWVGLAMRSPGCGNWRRDGLGGTRRRRRRRHGCTRPATYLPTFLPAYLVMVA
ncbi:hypothetical protein BS50DRAFT_373773 [Corynespora cassiicola Philippines]|uniref:Uncharacterized protein n=1 Tax=Corynespora cassiicola Philippines TaxID=1448308 RepID=A0A2T2NN00_CORCC|nr:hypothetical protein BS50DRAFT_373773 [Corynespora cassiicola Philippines]